jgi:hypothetical protein
MKHLFLASTSALLLAGCAGAQMPPPPPPGAYAPPQWDREAFWRGAPPGPLERIQFLQQRIDRGYSDGSLDRREAQHASRELNGIRQWIRNMHWEDGGRLTPDQRARVQERLDRLSSEIRWMRHNGW